MKVVSFPLPLPPATTRTRSRTPCSTLPPPISGTRRRVSRLVAAFKLVSTVRQSALQLHLILIQAK